MLIKGGGGLGAGRRPGKPHGQFGALGPKHLGGQLLCLGKGLGVVGALSMGCLVAADGGLVVGPLVDEEGNGAGEAYPPRRSSCWARSTA